MNLVDKAAQVGIVAGAAYLLTFCRGFMLAVNDQPTPLDKPMNYFVVLVAPACALYSLLVNFDGSFLKRVWPLGLIVFWVSWCLLVFTPKEYWPDQTQVISVLLAVLIASQISRDALRALRYGILVLAGVFSVVVLVWGRGLLNEALSGSSKLRFGADVSPSNVIFMPRVYYTFLFTGFASLVIERRVWLRLAAIATMGIPALMGFSTGSRGPLIALAAAVLVFVVSSLKQFGGFGKLGIILGTAVLVLAGYEAVMTLFPTLARRVSEDDTLRGSFYEEMLYQLNRNLSLVGQGKGGDYSHNIFLEFLQDYGVIGLVLFLVFFAGSMRMLWKVYQVSRDPEVSWVIGIILIQVVSQQFSMDIFVGSLWAALALPIGLGWWHEKMTRAVEARTGLLAQRRSPLNQPGIQVRESENATMKPTHTAA